MLVRMLYASRSTGPLTSQVIESILSQCRRNNPERGITGVLCHSDDIYLQVLEGGRDAVCDLLGTIIADTRHANLRIVLFEEISERRFGSWTMGQVNMSRVNASLLLKYSETAQLNPFNVPGRASLALLEELIATGAVIGRAG